MQFRIEGYGMRIHVLRLQITNVGICVDGGNVNVASTYIAQKWYLQYFGDTKWYKVSSTHPKP